MLKLAIIGFGSRGQLFASLIKRRTDVELYAVAEPVEASRLLASEKFGVTKERCYKDAEEFFAQGKIADGVFICSQDAQHCDMAIKALGLGYDICLEKPAAVTIEDCLLIRDTANALSRKVILTHVLRYSSFYRAIKEIVSSGELGEIADIDQTENIAYWHFALSYVRGPWRNMADSSPTIIAKCCHDLDIIKWLMNKKCTRVSSYGKLFYFNPAHAPKGSAAHCADCEPSVRENCVYNAYAIYPERMKHAVVGGVARLKGQSVEAILDEKKDPISRCVFRAGNDAIDNQVVNMEFADGSTAHLTMTAFTAGCHRNIKVHGTKGELYGDMEDELLHVNVFGGGSRTINVNEYNVDGVALNDGHGGGDYYLLKDFIDYLTDDSKPSVTRTTIDDSIESHIMGFKAEESRLKGGISIEL